MNIKLRNDIWIYLFSFILILFSLNCGEEKVEEAPPTTDENVDPIGYQPGKEKEIRDYNLDERKKRAIVRTVCDTIALMEYVLKTEEQGTFLVDFDRRFTYSYPQSAVIYQRAPDGLYVFALIAKSRLDRGERTIEVKNIVG
ncbi:MAG: hypothetical protein KGZ71_09400, partial [Desulfobulbaceae bacterium]|nr:hypothetical protein [Desulfobulbaceae bacterium]